MNRTLYRLGMTLATGLVSALGACADTPDQDAAPGGVGGKADGEIATIKFASNWSEKADAELVAGQTIAVDYDLSRLTTCVARQAGSDAYGVAGYASFDGAAPVAFAVSRIDSGKVVPVTAELAVPATAHAVELWFDTTNVFGCHAYDSNDSANYTFAIEQRAATTVVDFAADYTQEATGALHVGDQLVVHYEPSRLDTCAGSTNGRAAWGITGYYQVDGGAVKTFSPAHAEGVELVASDAALTIPRGHDVAFWFESTNVWGCHAYDSANGANYHFSIQ